MAIRENIVMPLMYRGLSSYAGLDLVYQRIVFLPKLFLTNLRYLEAPLPAIMFIVTSANP